MMEAMVKSLCTELQDVRRKGEEALEAKVSLPHAISPPPHAPCQSFPYPQVASREKGLVKQLQVQ